MFRSVALCALLLLAPVAVAMPATASTTGTASTAAAITDELPECDTSVRHEAFRHDNETVMEAQNGTATNTKSNTEISMDTNVAFVHLNAENPNGYCVRYIVEISPEVIAPADLGHIDANEGNETAHWRAIHDLEADQTYTQVEFVLRGGENATFAPSQVRVRSLKWTGAAKNATSGDLLPDVGSWFGDDDDLEQRKYTFSAENESAVVPIALTNESTGAEVDEYNALYRTDDSGWKPVGTDTSDPVFKREPDGGRSSSSTSMTRPRK